MGLYLSDTSGYACVTKGLLYWHGLDRLARMWRAETTKGQSLMQAC